MSGAPLNGVNVVYLTGDVDCFNTDNTRRFFAVRASKREIIVDIETLDTARSAVIASIGAVCIKIGAGTTPEIVDTFYARVRHHHPDTGDLHADQAGRTTSDETLEWWKLQSTKALVEALGHPEHKRHPLSHAVASLGQWLDQYPESGIWAKGSDFDNAILSDVFSFHGRAWPFRRSRCLRTPVAVAQYITGRTPTLPTRKPALIPHHALHDAIHEGYELAAMVAP